MKQCTKCKEFLGLDKFAKRKYASGKYAPHSWCKACERLRVKAKDAKKYAATRAAEICTHNRSCLRPAEPGLSRCKEHMDELKWKRLKKVYGLTPEDYDAMFEAQQGKCPITGDQLIRPHAHRRGDLFGPEAHRKAVVDHCHVSGTTRQILSGRANTLLGLMGEDPDRIREIAEGLIAYVTKWAAVKAA